MGIADCGGCAVGDPDRLPLSARWAMKQDLLRNIKWIAHSWGAWVKIAKSAPLHLAYRNEVRKAQLELVAACSEFNVWYKEAKANGKML
jgi:hypothetical protein